jgi:putative intracellular protease/amidase
MKKDGLKKFLFVLTSHSQLGDSGEKTGFHYSEMAEPYYILSDHGFEVDLASIAGGEPPIDPSSTKDNGEEEFESVRRFMKDQDAQTKLKNTKKVDDVKIDGYEGVYLPGGHGAMWDFPNSQGLKALLESADQNQKIIAAVCHGPAGFVNIMTKDGTPLVKDRRLNSFTDEEERAVKKDKIVPFLLETKLRELGGFIEKQQPFVGYVAEDSHLITGQNPKSASLVANSILRSLGIVPSESTQHEAKKKTA